MRAKSDDGRRCSVIFASLKRIANLAICAVGGGNDKRFSSGLMTVGDSKVGAGMEVPGGLLDGADGGGSSEAGGAVTAVHYS